MAGVGSNGTKQLGPGTGVRVWWWRRPSARRSDRTASCAIRALGGPRLPWGLNTVSRAWISLCLPTCLPLMFIPFVFIGPIFKLLPLWKALQGAGIRNKTLIKVHKTLILCSCRNSQQDSRCWEGRNSSLPAQQLWCPPQTQPWHRP